MRKWIGAALLGVAFHASGAGAQDNAQTLADIRQELTVLYVDIQRLKTELNTTGGASTGAGQGGSALDRLSAIEGALQRLTARTEELEYRVERLVADGTNRVGDLEFRLCELEAECDIGALGETPSLGGDAGAVPEAGPAVTEPAAEPEGPSLASNEAADFDRAQMALLEGDFAAAAAQFAAFNLAYPGGPFAAAAELGRGEALEGAGDIREAARAYLSAFSTDQLGPTAPDALYHLGAALGRLGQTQEACITLGEVSLRYPDAGTAVAEAADQMQRIGCS